MKHTGIAVIVLLLFGALLMPCSHAAAATDGIYTLSEVSATWDGTYANRDLAPIPAPVGSSYQYDYDHTYGDEAVITYNMPWPFTFYGQTYTQIKADTNGNVWFTATGSAHSFNLATTGHGPVIAAWNNDHSSYYYGGVFVQHKIGANSDRVVIGWQTETYTEEGNYRPNDFEVVLFRDGTIRFNYNAVTTTVGKDFGSGVSKGDGSSFLSLTANYGNVANLPGRSYQFQLPQITVDFAGTGQGTVTSTPAGIACTSGCSAQFQPGGIVTLTATPDPNSTFAGWSGACIGTAPCQLAMNDSKAVTATFNILPPVAAFSATPASGGTPFIATITDQSQRATSWSWNFGDDTTSTDQSPSHVYKTPGTYTVTLTAANAGGSSTATRTITVTSCQNQPVRILESNAYYPSLAAALGAAADGQTIQLQEWNFVEGATISKSVTLDGGYDCGYTNKTGQTVLEGELHITDGTVRMKDVRIAGTTPSTLPVISVAPPSDSFGNSYINTTITQHTLTATNIGGANLTIGNAGLSGANSGDFTISADTCSGRALTTGASCSVQVAFSPTATGPRTAVMAITSNDPATPTANVTLNGIGILPTLTIQKEGTGDGTISSTPTGISCGSGCSGGFTTGNSVTLTASPDADSSFAGWSGGCSGTGVCTVTMSTDLSVTATFNKLPAVADFNASSTSGGAPLFVGFTSISQFATSWLWDFGDGTSSSEQNPSHVYKATGTYTASLTAANVGGSSSTTKIITVNPCGTLPVKIGAFYYSTLQAAYDAAADGDTIQALALDFAENLLVNRAITATLEGGYMCGFSANPPDVTNIYGEPHTSSGTITMRNIHIR